MTPAELGTAVPFIPEILAWYSGAVKRRALLLLCLMVPPACDGNKTPERSDTAAGEKEAAKPVDATKQAAAKKAQDAIGGAPADMHAKLATAAVMEIDKASLTASLTEGLEAITDAPADIRAKLLAKTFSESMGLLKEVCGPDAEALMKSLAVQAPSGRDQAMWEGCELERHGLISTSDRAALDPLLALLGHMVFLHLGKGRTLSNEERSLLKAMMLKGETRP